MAMMTHYLFYVSPLCPWNLLNLSMLLPCTASLCAVAASAGRRRGMAFAVCIPPMPPVHAVLTVAAHRVVVQS